jgi:hypothetical protein
VIIIGTLLVIIEHMLLNTKNYGASLKCEKLENYARFNDVGDKTGFTC